MFILLHWYCHRGFGCGKMITFTLKIFNIFGDVYTRDGTISLCQRDASAQIVVSHNYRTQVLESIPFTPSVVTKWHDRHRYLSIHHVPHLMSLSSPRHCSKTLRNGLQPSPRDQTIKHLCKWLLDHYLLIAVINMVHLRKRKAKKSSMISGNMVLQFVVKWSLENNNCHLCVRLHLAKFLVIGYNRYHHDILYEWY